jgi:hypothetical protein
MTTHIDREVLQRVIRECIELLCRHFFPNGKKDKQQWKVADLDGGKGRSLNISLSRDKAGLFHDFATGESGDFVTVVMRSRNLDFVTAALEIGRATGVDVTMENQSHRSGPRYTTGNSCKPPDWDLDYKLNEADLKELASWRGYSMEYCVWANTHCLIGRRGGNQWAFPVCDNNKIVAAHVRYDKNNWQYKPRLQDIGVSLSPLIIGDLANAEKILFFESQWDGYALADKLGIQHGERIALVCTRGSSNAALAGQLQTGNNGTVPPEFYVVPQNDNPGQIWAEKIGTVLPCGYRLLIVPQEHHDANDWLQHLSSITELLEAIRNAELRQPVAKEQQQTVRVYIECHRPSYFLAYEPPPDLILCGDNHLVRGAVFVIGGAPGVGKSRASTALALAGALCVPWFGLEVLTEFKTLIIQSENGRFRLKQELSEINQPCLEDHLLICPPPPYGLCFSKSEFRDQLRYYQDYHGPQAVIVDPWNAVSLDDRMRDYREAFDIVREVFGIGSEKGPVLGILAHTRKPIVGERANGRALLNLLAGSYILGSIPRTVFVMQSASDDVNETQVVWTCCKNNDGKLGPRSAWERRNGLFVPVKDFDWEEFANPQDGRSSRLNGTIDDLLKLIPDSTPIKKDDLYAQAADKIRRNDIRDFIAKLLREARIFIHKIPNPLTKRSFTGYAKKPPSDADVEDATNDDTEGDFDIEDDPR